MSPQLSQDAIAIVDSIAAILLRCFILTVLALLFVWVLIVFQGDFFYTSHGHNLRFFSKSHNLIKSHKDEKSKG